MSMHRKTKDYLDEIYFWRCARVRLLQRAELLREHNPEPAAASGQALGELLHRCGLDTPHCCHGQAAPSAAEGARHPPPAKPED
jgi:hypothetical protein